MPKLQDETNNIDIGKYTYIEAANWVKNICDGSKTLNFNWRPGIGDGRALEKINEIFTNEININSNYEFLFRGPFNKFGASDEQTAALPNPPLLGKDRIDNMFKPRDVKYALASYSQPWDPIYFKHTIWENKFNKVVRNPYELAKFLQQEANMELFSLIRTKNAIGLQHINNSVDFVLKTQDVNADIFDPSKDYEDYTIKEDITHPQYLKKDEKGTKYGVILHKYNANSATSWDEAVTNKNLVEFDTISYINRPGSGSSTDEIKRNCELFLKHLQKLLIYFTLKAKEGNTLSGLTNSNDINKMRLLLLVNPDIIPELNVEVLNKLNNEYLTKFNISFELHYVENFTNEKVYAMLCDYDYLFINQNLVSSGVDVSHEGGFANHVTVYDFKGKTQFHKYVHLFVDPTDTK